MSYSTYTSILIQEPGYPQTSTASGYTTTTNVISQHITRADGLIDAKISKRYDVPISPPPPLLTMISEDIVKYYTYRSFYRQDNTNYMEELEEYKNDALNYLDEIRDAKIDLVNTAGSVISEKEDPDITTVDSSDIDYAPFFNVDDVYDWGFDEDKLDVIKDDRS